ncbi:MAG TPA: hypothetical protein VFA27_06930 [Vicinamibacterales bacterium]|nr:hypothetical protein [Vicinamibacterales bacterium]
MLAAVPRLVYLRVHPTAALNVYQALANGLLRDGSLSVDGHVTTQFEPLYPMILAAATFVLRAPILVDLLQIAIASLGAVFLSRLTLTLTNDARAATVAAVLYAIDPLLVREAVGHSESALFTTLLIAFAYVFVTTVTVADAALAGVCLGLAILTRTTALPLVVLAPALWLARRRPAAAGVLTAVAMLVVLPLPLRNHAVNGAWWPTRSGINLYIGNSPRTAELLPREDLDDLQVDADRLVHERMPAVDTLPGPAAERAIDTLLTREAIAFMAAHPLQTIEGKIRNVGYIFSPRIVPYRQDGHARPTTDVAAYAVFSTALLACAAVGVYSRRRCLDRDAILWAVAIAVVAVGVIYVPATRYRAPMEFVLAFYAAAAWGRSR